MTVDDLAVMIAKTLPTKEEVSEIKSEMKAGFHEVNKRLDKIELRLESLEERMDEIERRLDKIGYSLLK